MDHLIMHKEHKEWNSNLGMWIKDTQMWQKEYQAMLMAMENVMNLIVTHGDNLDDHLKALIHHQEIIMNHDRDISIVLENSSLDQELGQDHQKEKLHHHLLKQIHEEQKTFHHEVMVRVRLLAEVMDKVKKQ